MGDDTGVRSKSMWRNPTIWTLLLAALGVIVPILWDRYKDSSELTLQETSSAPIVDRTQVPNGLALTYEGIPVENLTKLAFTLSNTGRKPIQAQQILEPPRITFRSPTRILAAQIEHVAPHGIRVLPKIGRDKDWLEMSFPLLNAGDRVDFSVLLDQRLPAYETSARIAGVKEVSVSKRTQGVTLRVRDVPWTVYVVGLATIFCFAILVLGVHNLGEERRAYLLWKAGSLSLPKSQRPADLRKRVEQLFEGIKIPRETAETFRLLDSFPQDSLISDENTERVHQEVGRALADIDSLKGVLAIFISLLLVGLIYICYSLFQAIR